MLIFIKILVLVYLLLTFPIIGEEALPKCKIEANNIISQNYCLKRKHYIRVGNDGSLIATVHPVVG